MKRFLSGHAQPAVRSLWLRSASIAFPMGGRVRFSPRFLTAAELHVLIKQKEDRTEVSGQTYKVREALKQASFRWMPEESVWMTKVPDAIDGVIPKILALGISVQDERPGKDGLIERRKTVPGIRISTLPNSSIPVIRGSTYKLKDDIRAAGFRWSTEQKAWLGNEHANMAAIMSVAQMRGLPVVHETDQEEQESRPVPTQPAKPRPANDASAAPPRPASAQPAAERFTTSKKLARSSDGANAALVLTKAKDGLFLRGPGTHQMVIFLKQNGWAFKPFANNAWFKYVPSTDQTIETLRREAMNKALPLTVQEADDT